jgi:site-specific recombinase XerD
MNIDAFVDEYLVSRSPETEKAYRSDLRKFPAFLVEQGLEVETVRPTHIRMYVNWLSMHFENM